MTPEQLAIKAQFETYSYEDTDHFVRCANLNIPALLTALEAAQAEAEQLCEAVTMNGDRVTQAAHENAMLRAENARLREALGIYAKHGMWEACPSQAGHNGEVYEDWFMGDGNGWETAERALATNETPTTRTPSAPGSWRNAIGVLDLSGDNSDDTTNETPTV